MKMIACTISTTNVARSSWNWAHSWILFSRGAAQDVLHAHFRSLSRIHCEDPRWINIFKKESSYSLWMRYHLPDGARSLRWRLAIDRFCRTGSLLWRCERSPLEPCANASCPAFNGKIVDDLLTPKFIQIWFSPETWRLCWTMSLEALVFVSQKIFDYSTHRYFLRGTCDFELKWQRYAERLNQLRVLMYQHVVSMHIFRIVDDGVWAWYPEETSLRQKSLCGRIKDLSLQYCMPDVDCWHQSWKNSMYEVLASWHVETAWLSSGVLDRYTEDAMNGTIYIWVVVYNTCDSLDGTRNYTITGDMN